MPDQAPQNFSNHGKFVPLFHFLLLPAMFVNLVWRGFRVYQVFSHGQGRATPVFDFLVAFILIGLGLAARIFALQAQDRTIRLEEKLRWKEVLSPELAKRHSELSRGQIIALRFAPDDELPGLAARALSGDLKEPKAIKQAIKNWRPDYFRL
jgi:hypothetical protein